MTTFRADKKQILFVDDDECTHELVTLMLDNHEVVATYNSFQGLRLALDQYFDLYILDNRLPDWSGIGLCRAIREFDPHTPILFYSAAAYKRDIDEALRSGAQAYLIKPVHPDDLKLAVARLTSPVGGRDAEAWQAEIAVIREELATQRVKNTELRESAREQRLRAQEKRMRLKAERAFLVAGGTRGEFARLWPSVLVEEARSHRVDR
jgi:DNA-binding response OmpR family regulator